MYVLQIQLKRKVLKMKNKWFMGFCVLLIFWLVLAGCDTGTGGDDDGGSSSETVERLNDNATLAQAKAKVQELLDKDDLTSGAGLNLATRKVEMSQMNDTQWQQGYQAQYIPIINGYVDGYNSGQYKI
jgi:hypothetical protein